MGFNIKNNYGPNIDVHDGGVLHLHQNKDGKWSDDSDKEIEDAEIIEEVKDSTSESNGELLSDSRQAILNQMLDLADRGDWAKGITADDVKVMIKQVLGQGDAQLLGKESEMSETLWELLESGRGDRVRVTWQNMVGYLDSRNLLKKKTAPMLNNDFFGDKEGADNINKGRVTYSDMPSRFREVLPLLDAYVPKMDRKV